LKSQGQGHLAVSTMPTINRLTVRVETRVLSSNGLR